MAIDQTVWDRLVQQFIRSGGTVVAPNGLPIRAIRGGLALEHPHADHPGYLFPVEVKCHGRTEPWEPIAEHAVIAIGVDRARTLFEHQYYEWDLTDGSCLTNRCDDWRLADEGLAKIRAELAARADRNGVSKG